MITWLATVGKLEMAIRIRGLDLENEELDKEQMLSLRSCANLHWRMLNTIYHGENLFYLCLGHGYTDMTITTTIKYLQSLNLQSLEAENEFRDISAKTQNKISSVAQETILFAGLTRDEQVQLCCEVFPAL